MRAPIDTGDTAWMLVSTAFVLMMTIPGLALFYGGMVRKKNVLATLIQSFMICCIASLVWMVAGYSLAFSTGSPWIGDLSRVMLHGVADNFRAGVDSAFTLGAGTPAAVTMTIPESVFMMFQMTFAVITPALITGGYADRMKFSAMCLFSVAWLLLVYAPVAHWVWSPTGWVAGLGAVDFAGGTVVHINSGVAGLVCAIILGRRKGLGHEDFSPFNLTYAIIGASLLWVGWFGFNAGSALGANGRAGMAMLTTQVAAAAGGVAWMVVEWARTGKPTALGIISGAVAGLVAITPAAGFVLPGSAVGLPVRAHSTAIHATPPAAAASCVVSMAMPARPFAPSAEPALKPNQPTQSRDAPIMAYVRLNGDMSSVPMPRRLPRTYAQTRPATPELMCTTVPPAKSTAPRPATQPVGLQTQ